MENRDEIIWLRDLQSVYQQRYLDQADAILAQRIAHGIEEREWGIFIG